MGNLHSLFDFSSSSNILTILSVLAGKCAFLFHQLYPLPYSRDIPDFCYYPLSLLTSEFASSLLFSLIACSVVANPPASAEDVGSIPGWEDPLEQEMATHSSIPAWEISRRLQSVGSTVCGITKEMDKTIMKQQ